MAATCATANPEPAAGGLAVKTITVSATPLRKERISPLIYGEFVEFLNQMIPGMWADKLQDRSFAGLTEPGGLYRLELSFHGQVWRAFRCGEGPYGAPVTGEVAFDRDREKPFVGSQAARVRFTGDPGSLAGILQSGVAVKAGQKLHFHGYFRGAKLGGTVKVLLGRDYGAYFEVYDSIELKSVGTDWERQEGVLTSPVTDDHADFAIALDGPGTLWIGKVSLMPDDAVDGWRPDVVAAVKASKPGCIRFGGSSLIFYDWETGIGPREKRAPFINQPWGNTEEHDVGIAEFLRFCQRVKAEPVMCVNSNSGTAQSIAHEVEYCNGAATTPYGRKRVDDGYPKPFAVKYWQIGNEQAGREYEDRVVEFAKAMRAVDPSIEIIASFPSDRLINDLGGDFDVLCPHYYGPDVAYWAHDIDELRRRIAASPTNPHLRLGITEWNHAAGDWGDQRAWLLTMYNGLFVARMLNLYQRNSDMVLLANRSNLCNSECSGSVQTSPSDMYLTPAHWVQSLYANESGDVALKVQTTEDESLDVMATRDRKGKRLCVTVVNCGGEAQRRCINIEGASDVSRLRVTTIAAPSPSAVNSFAWKDHVKPIVREVKPSGLTRMDFPPYSVTAVVIETR
jgi:alpha-L-arabinofuranosidase